MEFYLSSPEIGPYVLTCPAELATALAAGHALLPHEDAYMGALADWDDRELDLETVFENLGEPDYSSPEYVGKPVFEAPVKRVWSHADIKALIKQSDDAVDRAMVALSKRMDLPPWQVNEVKGYAHWVNDGRQLTGRFLMSARTLALRNSHKLEEIANA